MSSCGQGGLLGVFPALSADGGIQVSGRIAWDAVRAAWGQGRGEPLLFTYGNGVDGAGPATSTAAAGSKPAAVVAALRRRWPVDVALFWHVGLLKLRPFFRLRSARVAVALFGIDAWRRQDWLTQRALRRVDLVLTISSYTWERFRAANPQVADTAHRTVWLGIGRPLSEPLPEPDRTPMCLMISRLLRTEDYKGHREMIRAWPHVLQRLPDAELCIAGSGDLGEDLGALIQKLGLQSHVKLMGHVSETEKLQLLGRSRCLAMPSRGEGFGLVYLEAMRMGRPCLVSTFDAGREVVDPPEAGLAVDPDDPQQTTEALCRLLTDGPDWHDWSTRARRRYERLFTAEQFQARLLEALRSLTPCAASPGS